MIWIVILLRLRVLVLLLIRIVALLRLRILLLIRIVPLLRLRVRLLLGIAVGIHYPPTILIVVARAAGRLHGNRRRSVSVAWIVAIVRVVCVAVSVIRNAKTEREATAIITAIAASVITGRAIAAAAPLVARAARVAAAIP